MRELLEAEEREKEKKRIQEEKDQAKRDKRKQKAQRAKVGAPFPSCGARQLTTHARDQPDGEDLNTQSKGKKRCRLMVKCAP